MAQTKVTKPGIADDAVETSTIKNLNVTNAKIAAGTIDVTAKITGIVPAANLGTGTASATTYLAGDGSYKTISEYDDNTVQSNIAMLGFKVAVNGSLVKYNLVDQAIDEYFDTSGVDSGASTGAARNASGKYYSGTALDPTGGTITTHGSYTVHSFLLADTGTSFTPGTSGNVSTLVVAGGGGSGYAYGGGGGAGGFRTDASHAVTGQAYTITVGDGGTGKTSSASPTYGADGGDSIFNTITSTGGGGGGGAIDTTLSATGRDGGSGGGSGLSGTVTDAGDGNTPSTSPSQGNDGTLGFEAGTVGGNAGGAGGGATASGSAGSSGQGGNGGAGTSNDYRTGSGVVYAGGGAGGSGTTGGTGGTGGGGNGTTTNGVAGTDDLGGGGGAGSNASGNGADGGSGIVVIRYTTADFVGVVQDMTLQSTDTTATTADPNYGELVTLIENAAGTATLNTDIKGYISEDSGVTFTQGTLVDEGTWGTNKKILGFLDLDISAQSGSAMCYKITTHNQSASKDTRVYATSIGWR